MKTLVLIRHAKSDWTSHGLPDFDRPLNKRGRTDAPLMADQLKQLGIVPQKILTSPANRARTTAYLMAEQFGMPGQEIVEVPSLYLGEPSDLDRAVKSSLDTETLFLYAHNPGISYYATLLAQQEIPMPTCCAAIFTISEGHESDFRATLKMVLRPRDIN